MGTGLAVDRVGQCRVGGEGKRELEAAGNTRATIAGATCMACDAAARFRRVPGAECRCSVPDGRYAQGPPPGDQTLHLPPQSGASSEIRHLWTPGRMDRLGLSPQTRQSGGLSIDHACGEWKDPSTVPKWEIGRRPGSLSTSSVAVISLVVMYAFLPRVPDRGDLRCRVTCRTLGSGVRPCARIHSPSGGQGRALGTWRLPGGQVRCRDRFVRLCPGRHPRPQVRCPGPGRGRGRRQRGWCRAGLAHQPPFRAEARPIRMRLEGRERIAPHPVQHELELLGWRPLVAHSRLRCLAVDVGRLICGSLGSGVRVGRLHRRESFARQSDHIPDQPLIEVRRVRREFVLQPLRIERPGAGQR